MQNQHKKYKSHPTTAMYRVELVFRFAVVTLLAGFSVGFASIRSPGRLSANTQRLFATTEKQARSNQKNEREAYIAIDYEDYFDGTKPDSSWNLAMGNFIRQGRTIIEQGLLVTGLKQEDPLRPPACLKLKLSNEAVKEAERERLLNGGGVVDAHPVSQLLYKVGCLLLDELFDERPIQRFWFLETIARIPYFSYVSMLHLYESFGWFRGVELRKVHAAEGTSLSATFAMMSNFDFMRLVGLDWNELHHLLIMESLGGNSLWSDRFLGYHAALLYYWFLVAVYLFSPRIAYQFMELLESHAVDTYVTFVRENRPRLAKLPAPSVAQSYYSTGDLYMFDDFQVSRKPGSRRPPCDTLLDVFENIAIDEGEHVKTMQACQDYAAFGTKVVSPHLNTAHMESKVKRKIWKEWSDSINKEG